MNSFAKSPEHKSIRVGVASSLATIASLYSDTMHEIEKFTEYLYRIGLIDNPFRVGLTHAGHALLQTLNTPVLQDTATDVVEIVLDPENPYAYAQALDAMSRVPDAMLVEPYFRIDELRDISTFDNITRVLVGPRLNAKDIDLLAMGLSATSRSLEIRQASVLHDRYLISSKTDEGVLMLGVSLNGIGKQVSTLTTLGPPASQAMRELHEDVWEGSEIIEAKRPPAEPPETDEPAP